MLTLNNTERLNPASHFSKEKEDQEKFTNWLRRLGSIHSDAIIEKVSIKKFSSDQPTENPEVLERRLYECLEKISNVLL